MEGSKQIANSENEELQKLYVKEKIPFFGEEIMKNSILKNNAIFLHSKIENNKSKIYNLILDRFGHNFFKESNKLEDYKNTTGKNSMNIGRKSHNFIKIKKKTIKQKKNEILKEKELNTKINMGSMTYLNLKDVMVSNKYLLNDKIFQLSKNLSISNSKKDVISEYIKNNKKKSENDKIKNNQNSNEKININNKNIKKNNFSLSQQNFSIPKKYFNLKKYLINNNNINSESLSKNDQINIETEKNNNNFPSTNRILSYKYKANQIDEIKKNINLNSILSNSQTDFNSSKISNSLIPKYNDTFHENEESKMQSLYLPIDMNETDINNHIIYNKYKCLSTNETNETNKVNKNHILRNNSLINLSSALYIKNKFTKNLYKKTDLLKNLMTKNNNRLVKLIDRNFQKKINSNSVKEINRKEQFKLIKAVFGDKNTNKIIKKYKKLDKKIKPILKMSQKDENQLITKKNLNKKFFLKNYKNMEDNWALTFVGKLYNTKYIKFQLKEFRDKRKEIEKKIEKENLDKIRKKIILNNIKLEKIKYILLDKKNKFEKNKSDC